MTQKTENDRNFYRLINRAYIRDSNNNVHSGEALLLACLVKVKVRGRESVDMRDVRKIMHDQNIDN